MPVLNIWIIGEYSFQPNAEENNTHEWDVTAFCLLKHVPFCIHVQVTVQFWRLFEDTLIFGDEECVIHWEQIFQRRKQRLPKKVEKLGEKWNLVILKSQRLLLDLQERRKRGGSGIGSQGF